MLWIAAIVALCIVASVVMHAVRDNRYADAQRLEALADIESRSRVSPDDAGFDGASFDRASQNGTHDRAARADLERGVPLPPAAGDISASRPGQVKVR